MPPAAKAATNISRITPIVLVGCLLAPVAAHAGRVSLAWDPSPESFVAGYVLHYGTAPGVYDSSVDVGNTTSYVVYSLTNGVTYYFVVRAYSVDFVYSDPSNEVGGVPANSAPSVLTPGDITMEPGPLYLPIAASDPDFDDLTYAATGLPTGLVIALRSGVISGNVPAGTHRITVTVSDGAAQDSTETLTITANTPPTLANPGDRTDAEGQVVSLQLAGSDPDGNPITYSAGGLPPGLTLDMSSGLIAGTLPYTAAGAYATALAVSDGSTTTEVSITWTVTHTNRAPVVTNTGDQGALQGIALTLSMTADDPDGDALAWSAVNLPPGIAIDASTGVLSGTSTTLGTFAVVVSAFDGSATGEAAFSWTVCRFAAPPAARRGLAWIDGPGRSESGLSMAARACARSTRASGRTAVPGRGR